MPATRRREHGRHDPTESSPLPRRISAGVVTLAISGTLIAGAWLQVDSEAEPIRLTEFEPAPAPATVELEVEPTPPAAPAATPVRSEPSVGQLARRAGEDRERIPSEGWVLQLVAACDPDNVKRLVGLAGASERLYLLPALLDDRPCFRVCWGTYPSRDRAVQAIDDLPAPLRAEIGRPAPRPVEELLEP